MKMDIHYEKAFVQEQLSKTWPNWQISRKLGSGSYGSVYEIERNDLGTRYTCALKVLHLEAEANGNSQSVINSFPASAGILDSPTDSLIDRITDTEINEFVRGVSSEINLMMQLKGVPNIVSIEDYAVLQGDHKCTILIRMEELEPLDNRLARKGGSFDKAELVRLGTDICSALISCEHKNILHRDIKPNNLFYSPEAGYKLGDFGISRTMASIYEKASMSGIGTRQYIAPEIYQGRKYNNTADIYSLGIVLYVLANKQLPPLYDPASGHTASGLTKSLQHDANMRRLRGEPLPRPCNADDRLSSVICTACDPVPERRFQTAEAFRNALLSCLDEKPAKPEKSPLRINKKSLTVLYALIAVAAVILGFVGGSLLKVNKTPSETNTAPSSVETSDHTGEQPDKSGEDKSEHVVDPADSTVPADSTDSEEIREGEETLEEEETLIEWSDPNLRDAVVPQVQKALGISSEPTILDARKMTELDLANAGISDISSLQYFIGLNKLSLSDNTISDISPLADLKKLEDLDLEKNMISDLTPLSGLVRLTRLDLYNNEITDISPLADLTRLNNLDIRTNKVDDISAVKDMILMEELYLSENEDLFDISAVSNMSALRYLSVRQTSVSQIDSIRNNRNLHSLIVSWSNVSDISVVDILTDLSYLDIRNCPIRDYGPADRVKSRKGTKVDR